MRKWSMKKVGTPICAGPGGAGESVGVAGVGAPSGRLGAAGAGFLGAGFTRPAPDAWLSAPPAVFAPERPVRVPRDAGAFGFGLLIVGVGFGRGVGVTVTFGTVGIAVGVAVVTAPRSWIVLIGAGRPGIGTEPTGVPGGTSTVRVSCWPVTRVTSTRCSCADAVATRTPA